MARGDGRQKPLRRNLNFQLFGERGSRFVPSKNVQHALGDLLDHPVPQLEYPPSREIASRTEGICTPTNGGPHLIDACTFQR